MGPVPLYRKQRFDPEARVVGGRQQEKMLPYLQYIILLLSLHLLGFQMDTHFRFNCYVKIV